MILIPNQFKTIFVSYLSGISMNGQDSNPIAFKTIQVSRERCFIYLSPMGSASQSILNTKGVKAGKGITPFAAVLLIKNHAIPILSSRIPASEKKCTQIPNPPPEKKRCESSAFFIDVFRFRGT